MPTEQSVCRKRKKGLRSFVGILSFMTVWNMLLGSSFMVNAEVAWPEGPEIIGENAIVMEVNSGTVLYERGAHEQYYPASITKILTALLAVENNDPDEEVTFSYDSVHKTEGSSISRDVGEIMTLEECLYGLMLNSANECAYAVAEHVGGTYENFIKMMNDRAKALGCENTNFVNPHGLTEEEHLTTCYDMALIAREAFLNEEFRVITGSKRYQIPPTNKHPEDITYLINKQKMLWENEEYYYEDCIGGKTGYTEAAGSTLVTYAERDGMTLVCVVMKSKSPHQFEDTITLLDYCFDNFEAHNISENISEEDILQLPESDILDEDVSIELGEDDKIILPVGVEFSEAEMEIIYDDEDSQIVGDLQYTYGEYAVGSATIKVTEEDFVESQNIEGDGEENLYEEENEYEEENLYEDEYEEENLYEEDEYEEENLYEEDEYEGKKKARSGKISKFLIVILLLIAAFGIYQIKENFYVIRYYFYCRMRSYQKREQRRRRRRRRRR